MHESGSPEAQRPTLVIRGDKAAYIRAVNEALNTRDLGVISKNSIAALTRLADELNGRPLRRKPAISS